MSAPTGNPFISTSFNAPTFSRTSLQQFSPLLPIGFSTFYWIILSNIKTYCYFSQPKNKNKNALNPSSLSSHLSISLLTFAAKHHELPIFTISPFPILLQTHLNQNVVPSKDTCLGHIVEHLGQSLVLVLPDLPPAFDTGGHTLLHEAVPLLGFSDTTLSWFLPTSLVTSWPLCLVLPHGPDFFMWNVLGLSYWTSFFICTHSLTNLNQFYGFKNCVLVTPRFTSPALTSLQNSRFVYPTNKISNICSWMHDGHLKSSMS